MGSYKNYKMFGMFSRRYKINEAAPNEDVKDIFSNYSNKNSHLSADQMLQFLIDFQGEEDSTLSHVQDIIHQVLQQRHGDSAYALTLDDFFYYIFNDHFNGPIRTKVHHDMDDPLQHYFIYTGHNSYLTGNQLSSDCSDVPIIKALERGVRAIELDIWPNSSRDNINVLHGRTLTAPVPLIKCLKSIKEHAFVQSPYPVIITLEDHLTPSLQAKAAEMLIETFGDSIYYPEADCSDELPSPESLKHRFIFSTKPPKEYLESKNSKDKESSPVVNETSPMSATKEASPLAKVKETSPMAKVKETSPMTKGKETSPMAMCKETLPMALGKETLPMAKSKETSPMAMVKENSPLAKDNDSFANANKTSAKVKETLPKVKAKESSPVCNDSSDEESIEKDVSPFTSTEQDAVDKSESDVEDEDGDGKQRQSSQPCVNDQYKRLIAIHAGKPKKGLRLALTSALDKVRRLSVSEQELEKAAISYAPDVVRFTQNHLLRVYPKGTRISSSNYKPFTAWMHGAQMVAFNMQGYGKFLWLMHGMFKANGGCGYLKKPDFLIKNGEGDDVFDPRVPLPVKTTLKVKVLLGDGWRLDFSLTHFDAYSPPDFYTKVHIFGASADFAKKKTKVKVDNWAPVWAEEFTFPLTVPEIALLRIVVREHDRSEKDDFGGQTCLPISELKTGIRAVPLYDKRGNKYESVKLLMLFQFL